MSPWWQTKRIQEQTSSPDEPVARNNTQSLAVECPFHLTLTFNRRNNSIRFTENRICLNTIMACQVIFTIHIQKRYQEN